MSDKTMKLLAKPMLFAAAFFWGASFMLMKGALDSVPTGYLIAIRFTAGTPLVALISWKHWKDFSLDYLWRGGLAGLLLFSVYWAQTVGLETTTASNNAFLSAVYCVIVPFMTWLLFRERPDRYNVTAALLCIAGVGFVSLTDALTISVGDGFTVVQLAAVALCAWVLALTTEVFDFSALARPEVIWPMLYLCVMATAVCLVLMNVGLVWSEPAPAAVILSLEAVFGVILAVIFYGDPLTPRLLIGFTLIFVGVLCSETKFSFLRKKA